MQRLILNAITAVATASAESARKQAIMVKDALKDDSSLDLIRNRFAIIANLYNQAARTYRLQEDKTKEREVLLEFADLCESWADKIADGGYTNKAAQMMEADQLYSYSIEAYMNLDQAVQDEFVSKLFALHMSRLNMHEQLANIDMPRSNDHIKFIQNYVEQEHLLDLVLKLPEDERKESRISLGQYRSWTEPAELKEPTPPNLAEDRDMGGTRIEISEPIFSERLKDMLDKTKNILSKYERGDLEGIDTDKHVLKALAKLILNTAKEGGLTPTTIHKIDDLTKKINPISEGMSGQVAPLKQLATVLHNQLRTRFAGEHKEEQRAEKRKYAEAQAPNKKQKRTQVITEPQRKKTGKVEKEIKRTLAHKTR